jgi:hypothetical protein
MDTAKTTQKAFDRAEKAAAKAFPEPTTNHQLLVEIKEMLQEVIKQAEKGIQGK